MRPYTNGSRSEYNRLRNAYDRAFHQLSSALERNSGVTAAEQEYHERRDALFIFLVDGTHTDQHAPAVQRLAYVLWDHAGRPPGPGLQSPIGTTPRPDSR
jgi:hypothetical protein